MIGKQCVGCINYRNPRLKSKTKMPVICTICKRNISNRFIKTDRYQPKEGDTK